MPTLSTYDKAVVSRFSAVFQPFAGPATPGGVPHGHDST